MRPPVSLGVRLLVRDTHGRILLVRHTYLPGWHCPGGGVDVGESAEAAARRECREETGIEAVGAARLVGLYFNRRLEARDHVALYLIDAHPPLAAPARSPSPEIAAVTVAPWDAPPDGTSAPTLRRLAEVFGGEPPAGEW